MSRLSINIDQFRQRLLEDCLIDATAIYWRRRAATLEWARPRPDDYCGRGGPAEVAERDAALAEAAEACQRKALLIESRSIEVEQDELHDVLVEVAA